MKPALAGPPRGGSDYEEDAGPHARWRRAFAAGGGRSVTAVPSGASRPRRHSALMTPFCGFELADLRLRGACVCVCVSFCVFLILLFRHHNHEVAGSNPTQGDFLTAEVALSKEGRNRFEWVSHRANRDHSVVGRAQQTQRTQKFGEQPQAAVALLLLCLFFFVSGFFFFFVPPFLFLFRPSPPPFDEARVGGAAEGGE